MIMVQNFRDLSWKLFSASSYSSGFPFSGVVLDCTEAVEDMVISGWKKKQEVRNYTMIKYCRAATVVI